MIRKSLLAAAAALLAFSAQAASVNYSFGGTLEAGSPLAGQTFSGSFSFDDSVLPNLDGYASLTALTLLFNGNAYTLAGANAGSATVDFDTDGRTVIGLDAVWGASGDLVLSNGFGAPFLTDVAGNFGYVTFTAQSAVPEPSSWLLGFAGLAVMGAAVRRRKAQ